MVKIVMVCTNPPYLANIPTGLWLEEASTPYYAFVDAGYEVVIASPTGGPVPIDANSMLPNLFTESGKRFLHDPAAMGALHHSVKLDTIDWSVDIDVIFMTGGHGTCVDFINNPTLKNAIETMYAADKIVSAVCHGPSALCDCTAGDGSTPLVAGKKVTGLSDSEEKMMPLLPHVPFLIETKFKEQGAIYEKSDQDWHSKVCIDGKLITGQNPASSQGVAEAVIAMLS